MKIRIPKTPATTDDRYANCAIAHNEVDFIFDATSDCFAELFPKRAKGMDAVIRAIKQKAITRAVAPAVPKKKERCGCGRNK